MTSSPSVQLYTVRDAVSADLQGAVARIAEIGFTKVERAKEFPHLYFRVDDVEGLCQRVAELGGKAAAPAETKSGKTAVVSDDQGVSFSLWQPAPGF